MGWKLGEESSKNHKVGGRYGGEGGNNEGKAKEQFGRKKIEGGLIESWGDPEGRRGVCR